MKRVDTGLRQQLQAESRIRRSALVRTSSSVDVVLYFFAPHRCKRVDIALLRLLCGKVSVVPILAKADSMTAEELERFREEVVRTLQDARIDICHAPLAVITSSRPAGTEPCVQVRVQPNARPPCAWLEIVVCSHCHSIFREGPEKVTTCHVSVRRDALEECVRAVAMALCWPSGARLSHTLVAYP